MSELLNEFSLRQMIDPATALPDHSLIMRSCELPFRIGEENINGRKPIIMEETVIYKREISDNFMEEKVDKGRETVNKLNENLRSQKNIDDIYDDLIGIVTTGMGIILGKLKLKLRNGVNNNKRSCKSPAGQINCLSFGMIYVKLRRQCYTVTLTIKVTTERFTLTIKVTTEWFIKMCITSLIKKHKDPNGCTSVTSK